MKEKLLNILQSNNDIKDLFVDCGQGDKFQIIDIDVNEKTGALYFKIHKGSVKWIEIDGKYPVKITTNNK
jgi:hypothetical protein